MTGTPRLTRAEVERNFATYAEHLPHSIAVRALTELLAAWTALDPFATMSIPENFPDAEWVRGVDCGYHRLTNGHVRTARAALPEDWDA